MRFTGFSFGSIRVDGVTYDHDLVIDRGKIRRRKKAPSRKFRGAYGHTPLTAAEDIPWRCRRLVIGTGADGALPVTRQVHDEARRRKVDLVVLPTAKAIGVLAEASRGHQRYLAPDLLNPAVGDRDHASISIGRRKGSVARTQTSRDADQPHLSDPHYDERRTNIGPERRVGARLLAWCRIRLRLPRSALPAYSGCRPQAFA